MKTRDGRRESGLRQWARGALLTWFRRVVQSDDGRRALGDVLKGTMAPRNVALPNTGIDREHPYPELGRSAPRATTSAAPVFITGRFRSGSTLLWQMFRRVPRCTAYYEPLNERRWFDRTRRGTHVDATHLGVADYWSEYDALPHLDKWYRQEWTDRNLYMDAQSWDPHLCAYVRALIDAAPHRAVLQFNRVDFRLPFLRHNFPEARLLHLYRHPRDQWCSALMDANSFSRTGTIAEFEEHDHFYLLAWARDLAYQFPFLDPRTADHPYDLFYGIWKLSYLFGRQWSNASFCLEALCESPSIEVPRLMDAAGVQHYDIDALTKTVIPQKSGKWRAYADQDWFEAREARCEETLSRFLSATVARPASADRAD